MGRKRTIIAAMLKIGFNRLFPAALILLAIASVAPAQSTDDCLACHGDNSLTTRREGQTISLYVDEKVYRKSIHGESDCISCHADLADAEFPHKTSPEAVDCGLCHAKWPKFMTAVCMDRR